jgi:micrococcal nuclease
VKNCLTSAKIFIIVLISLLGGCSSIPNPEGIRAEVYRVVSGQSVEVKLVGESPDSLIQIRLIGITAPDLKQEPWGTTAKEQLTNILTKSTPIFLEFETKQSDQYGRKLAHIWYQNQLISQMLVEKGYVLAETRFEHKYRQNLILAQEYARLMGLGIWNPQKPMNLTPQEFRTKNNS